MLNELQLWFFNDPNAVVALAITTAAVCGLALFYFLSRNKKSKVTEEDLDPYQAFLDEEFKLDKKYQVKETVILELPPPTVPEFIDVVKKPARKKAAKKKTVAKKKTSRSKKANGASA